MSDREEDDEQEQDQASSEGEGEGEDIGPDRKKGADDDSSEEEEDDPEEARRIAEGFIADEDEEEDDSDGNKKKKSKGKKKKRRERHSSVELEDDDLDLLLENTGAKPRVAKPTKSKPKKLRRRRSFSGSGSSEDEDDDDDVPTHDLQHIFDDMPRKRKEAMMLDDDGDDMADFIEEDEGLGDDDEEAERARRKEKKRRLKNKQLGTKQGGEGGIDKAAWDDIYDVFGNGDEYDWVLEDEEQQMGGLKEGEKPNMHDVFEPSEIQERHLGLADDLIRLRDIPERHQLLNSTLSSQPTYVPDPFPAFPNVRDAALWISTRLSARTKSLFIHNPAADMYAEPPPHADLYPKFLAAIQRSLEFMFHNQLEVPFVYEHRRDYITHILADDQQTDLADWETQHTLPLLNRDELWKVYDLGLKYRSLHERREGLDEIWLKRLMPRLPRDDEGDDSDGMDMDDEDGNPIKKRTDPRKVYLEEHVLNPTGTANEGIEGVVDALDYIRSAFTKEMRELKEEEDEMRREGDVKAHKKPSGMGGKYGLEKLRETRLSIFIKSAAIPVEQAVSINLNTDSLIASQGDPPTLPLEYASEFTDPRGPLTEPSQVLEAVSSILVQDFTKSPTLRKMVRQLFKDEGVLTVLPTEKGLTKIDNFHPYYNFKYLKNKQLAELMSTSVFLHILEAEKELLVTVDISLPEQIVAQLESVIFAAYRADGYSEKAAAWNEFRKGIVEKAVRTGLVPLGSKWVREFLKTEVEDFTAWTCGRALEESANQSPYRPKVYEKGDAPSVLVVSHGQGGPKDAVMCVFIDESGRVRETVKFDHLDIKHASFFDQQKEEGESKPTDEFKDFVSRRKPAVVVVGGLSYSTHRLTKNVKTLITTLAEDTMKEKDEEDARAQRDRPQQSEADREQNLKDATIPVIYVPDNVARIYQHSLRAQQEFPTQPTTGRYAIGLGRYAQSPIHEFCALGADISAITFNEDSQNLVPREKLLLYLERALVNVVNDVGVAINDVVGDSYNQHVLPFVAGLGPRKAKKLVADIVRSDMGALNNRGDLLRNSLLSLEVFTNAAAFLEIKHDLDELELGDNNTDSQPDPLDQTRIHPDDYEFARKMADNALDLDAEDTADDHPSKGVVRLMTAHDADELLKELSLGDFAENLRKVRGVEKRLALEALKSEITAPAKDRRRDFVIPNDWQVLTMLTGESYATLQPGIIVAATVQRITPNDVFLLLDSKIEGHVKLGFVADPHVQVNHPGDILVKKQIVRAICIDAKPADFNFEFSTRPSDMANGDDMYRVVNRLEPFDRVREAADLEALEKKKKKETEKIRRQIDHPNFYNFSASQAEQHLVNMQRGDAVIRPSSKGVDRLALTWKVDDDLYQHIEVEERNKPNPTALGQILRVGDKYTYHDLDDLIVSHVGEIVSKGNQLMRSDKFKGRSIEELHNWLRSFVLAHPGKSNYAFAIDRKRPGYFVLSFLNKSESDGGSIQNWPVKVNPGSFRLGEADCAGVQELCNAFKMQYAHISQNPAGAGGKTPHGGRLGGATPAYGGRTPAGGRTPGGSRLGGATPNPFAGYAGSSGQTPAYGGQTGRTPNPYGSGVPAAGISASTSNPYQPTPNGSAAFPPNLTPGFTPGFPTPQQDPAMAAYYAQQQQQGYYPPPAQAGGGMPYQQQPQSGYGGLPPPPPPAGGAARGPAINPARIAMMQGSQGGGGY